MSDDREIFLEAARKRFQESGIDDVSLEEIAAEVALDMDVVLKHFPEKLALVFTLLLEELGKVAESTMQTLPETSIEAQFKHLLKGRFEFLYNHRSSSAKVIKEVFFSSEGWREAYDNMLWRFSVGAVALLQAAKRRGEIRSDADEQLAARAIVSYYLSGMLMVLRGDVNDPEGACDFTFPLLENLLKSLQ